MNLTGKFNALVKWDTPYRKRLALAGVAGVGLACAYPKLNWAGLAWVVPAIWLLCSMGRSGRERFYIGLVGGLCFCLPALHWFRYIPYPIAPYIGWVALSAYLALYPAFWVWLCWRIFPARLEGDGSEATLPQLVERFFSVSWAARAAWILSCAVIWVATEMLIGSLLTGFPFLFLGISQQTITPMIQIASITGVCGVSFLVVWFSVGLASACLLVIHRPGRHWLWARELGLPGMAAAAALVFGVLRVSDSVAPQPGEAAASDGHVRTLRIALVQPSIPQTVKWDDEANLKAFQIIQDLSAEAMKDKPDVVIWPEAAMPKLLQYDEDTYRTVTSFARENKVWMLIGGEDAIAGEGPEGEKNPKFFNSAFVVTPEGEVDMESKYDKRHLVIFGEYVPLADWLPFLRVFSPVGSGFTAGTEPVWMKFDETEKFRVAPLICFEDCVASLAREHVDAETDFLLNLTNDGWFGASSQQWQHAANSAFRAVENGVPIVRCANNGLSCWADKYGVLHGVEFENGQSIYEAGYKIVELEFRRPRAPGQTTFYNRHGDWFGWGCVLLSAALLAQTFRKRA
ncbi:MAG: apolipoprotein N-acyltransferase [Limisphaerales bacterium]|jgi:apolipoprotein N-acyltransferase